MLKALVIKRQQPQMGPDGIAISITAQNPEILVIAWATTIDGQEGGGPAIADPPPSLLAAVN